MYMVDNVPVNEMLILMQVHQQGASRSVFDIASVFFYKTLSRHPSCI